MGFTALLEALNATKEELLARTDLATILQYHVITSQILSSDLAPTQDVTTLSGDSLTVTNDGTTVMAGPATVVTADVVCSNGVIHAIDAVLLPPAATPAPAPPSIVDTAVGNGAFTVLVEALQEAELVDALSGPGPFTVFDPTDAAFTALLEALNVTKEELLAREDLATILLYHVISGQVVSSDLAATQYESTLMGAPLTVTSDGTTVMAGHATVVIADVLCSNGVIHAIDAVLLPPAPAPPSIVDTAVANGGFTVLVEALQTAELVDALSGPGPFT